MEIAVKRYQTQISKISSPVQYYLVSLICFEYFTQDYISVDSKRNCRIVFGKKTSYKKVKTSYKQCIDNFYFVVSNSTSRHVIGIPKGFNAAPFMANLFLHYFEYWWNLNLKKSNLHKAISFSNKLRLINDLCAVNDNGLILWY